MASYAHSSAQNFQSELFACAKDLTLRRSAVQGGRLAAGPVAAHWLDDQPLVSGRGRGRGRGRERRGGATAAPGIDTGGTQEEHNVVEKNQVQAFTAHIL